MLTKLTLSIEKDVIEKAKIFAQGRRTSVSRLVQEYLSSVSATGKTGADGVEWTAPITDGLVGMFEDDGQDYKTLLEEALEEGNR